MFVPFGIYFSLSIHDKKCKPSKSERVLENINLSHVIVFNHYVFETMSSSDLLLLNYLLSNLNYRLLSFLCELHAVFKKLPLFVGIKSCVCSVEVLVFALSNYINVKVYPLLLLPSFSINNLIKSHICSWFQSELRRRNMIVSLAKLSLSILLFTGLKVNFSLDLSMILKQSTKRVNHIRGSVLILLIYLSLKGTKFTASF